MRASCAQVWRTLSTPAAQQYYLQRFKEKQEEERKESGTERQRNSKGGRNGPFPAGRRVADSQPLATARTMPSQVRAHYVCFSFIVCHVLALSPLRMGCAMRIASIALF